MCDSINTWYVRNAGWLGFSDARLLFCIRFVVVSSPSHSTDHVLVKMVSVKSLLSCAAFNPYRSKRM